MRTLRTLALGVIGALGAASPLLAHHEWPVERTTQIHRAQPFTPGRTASSSSCTRKAARCRCTRW
jgi:hypothetical protein